MTNPEDNYKYNDKEYQKDLSEYDYGARFKTTEVIEDMGTLDGSFSISNWGNYPTSMEGMKPSGPFRLLEGFEYQEARNLRSG